MMFHEEYARIDAERIREGVASLDEQKTEYVISEETLAYDDFLHLLSPAASASLDAMALRSRAMTQKHFGRNIGMYIPLYVSNECANECIYCGFNRKNDIRRKTLAEDEIDAELESIRKLGFDSILILTGEFPAKAGTEYIARCVTLARRHFSQVSLEIYPMDTDGYRQLVDAGATGLSIYQETYDRETYARVHRSGRKTNFEWRLDAPDRAAEAGFRKIGIGALLGLHDWRIDAAYVGAHAAYLMKKHWRTEVSISFPRMRGSSSHFTPACIVTDRELVQMIFAFRLYTRSAAITLSTREAPSFRDNMVDLGVTNMSAGSKTNPGGYETFSENESDGQFEISDDRSVDEVAKAIQRKGYHPVFKDWTEIFGGVRA